MKGKPREENLFTEEEAREIVELTEELFEYVNAESVDRGNEKGEGFIVTCKACAGTNVTRSGGSRVANFMEGSYAEMGNTLRCECGNTETIW